MAITVEAVYEHGVLKPAQPLPFREHETVELTIRPVHAAAGPSAGVISCTDPQLIEWAATDPDLAYPPPPEEP
ncbi:MAG TPA: antitoxin family protein [Gemmataceae bacterium]|jgi:predicted DNA-binding antitoxin AbrB/MazE fold protein